MASDSYDDDLPSVAAQPVDSPARPRDAATGQFVSPQPTREPAAPEPPAHQHSAYALAKAREFGIAGAESMAPAELDRFLSFAERHRQPARPAAPAPEPEEPIDWGADEDGKPLTEAHYAKPVAAAIRAAHDVKALKKQNADLQAKLDRQEQERSARAATRQLQKVLAARPDLFGANPGEAEPGSPEAERYQIVLDRLNRLVATKQHTTLDADAKAAMALFGPAPQTPAPKPGAQPKPAARPTLADYARGELAPPTARRGTEQLSRRQQMIDEENARRKENGVLVQASADDDDDLPG